MTIGSALQLAMLVILPLSVLTYVVGVRRTSSDNPRGTDFHSPSAYYGWYSVFWVALPSMIVFALAFALHLFKVVDVPGMVLFAGSLALAAMGLFFSQRVITREFRAIHRVERTVKWFLICASSISIMITIGIVMSIIFEAIEFFKLVSLWDFLTGTRWSPDTAFLMSVGRDGEATSSPDFGSLPLFAGTFYITFIALCVAVPMGLFSAIYMSEYANTKIRKIAKPALEILAGIPTVVYGFFAVITVSPLVVSAAEHFGLNASYTNALSPGLVMGVMIIPLVSSLSDDVITAVPQAMREGSYALGATTSETIRKVVLPAALPGVVSAILLAVSRAVGETMIVVMAAGLMPNITWNPLESMTTVTVSIVDSLTGDQAFDSPQTLSAFGLGLVLLVVTLVLNVVSLVVIRKFREQYE
jgi:phosphate transport system permease protein